MVTCDNCGASTHPFGLTFQRTHENLLICSACELHNNKVHKHDWKMAKDVLETNLLSISGKRYDVLVPVRGDAEDYYVVNYLKSLNRSILVVVVNNYFLNDLAWSNIHNLITEFDVDSILYNPNYISYKEFVATSLRKFNSIYLPYKAILHRYIMMLAKEKHIPLVVFGQCQPQEIAGKFSYSDNLRLSNWWVVEHEKNGITADEFIGSGLHLQSWQYDDLKYPPRKVVSGVTAIFLSNYLFWDQAQQNKLAHEHGYSCGQENNAFDQYENTGSSVYYNFHDFLRIQSGHEPKLFDQLRAEVRFGRMTKTMMLKLQRDFLSAPRYYFKNFFTDFLGSTNSGFDWYCENRITNRRDLLAESELNELSRLAEYQNLNEEAPPREQFVRFQKGI